MPRKPTYTPEERKIRQAAQSAHWQQANTTTINVRTSLADKARYAAYADNLGLPVASMLRACAERCMMADGWTWQPTAEELEQVQAEAEERRRKAEGKGEGREE